MADDELSDTETATLQSKNVRHNFLEGVSEVFALDR